MPEPPPDPGAAWDRAVGVCFTDPRFGDTPYDLRYLGPVDTPANAETYSSTDGSCSGDVRETMFVLRAPNLEAAGQRCAEWGGSVYPGLSRVADWWPEFPPDGFICFLGDPPS